MSIFHPASAICQKCGTKNEVERNASINVDSRQDLRDEILDGSFQAQPCTNCATTLRLPPHLSYLDVGRAQWIMARPADELENWEQEETDARATFERSFGAGAPPSGQELGKGMQARLVFGWPALREKVLAHDIGLDDVTLEMLKISIMRSVNKPPIADQTELRLTAGNADTLDFTWVVAATEQRLVGLSVPREVYDDIAADPEPWAALRASFDDKLLVDLRRMVAGKAVAETVSGWEDPA